MMQNVLYLFKCNIDPIEELSAHNWYYKHKQRSILIKEIHTNDATGQVWLISNALVFYTATWMQCPLWWRKNKLRFRFDLLK